ncbi:hypothetical protein [Mycolicibacterium iranicum]|uniref:Cadherin domain-containing protein n=1 Tax=Mycolicibacterium iranicum TaxID=912594 RepID=A0ABT4HNC1_MYCIR|nr:hypothetical protein [Mycolicibacterium iranicum]MCZ0731695.1 hypothetical protein [Mycolicibacterium iranicum]
MSANQARHRIARDESGAPTVNRFWAAKELLDLAQPTGSPRHMQQASNRHLCVGRVGALAVSLGIGFALYTSATGVAFAAETGSSSTGADGSNGGQPQASDNDDNGEAERSAENKEGYENGDGETDNAGGEDDDDVTADVDENTGAEPDGIGPGDEDEQKLDAEIVDSDAHEPQVGSGSPDTPLGVSGSDKTGDHDDIPTGPQDETPPPATVDTSVAEPPASIAPAVEPTEPEGGKAPETVEVAFLAPVKESAQETEVIRMAVSNVVSPLLSTGNPIQSALTDTLLAWVRRLISHTFFNKTPVISGVTTSEFLGTRTITINATDPNGDPLTYEVVTGPSKGVLVPGLIAGTFTYVPNPLELLGGPYTETLKFRVRDDSEHLTGVYGTIQSFLENVARWLGLAKADTVETKEITFTVGAGDIELGLPPLVTASGGKTYRLGSSGIAPITSVSINDIDSDYVTGAIVSVKTDDLLFSKFIAGDKLSFTDTADITGVYDESTGVLTLSGRATKAAYEVALESVTFTATQVVERFLGLGFVGRTLSIVVSDDTGASNSLFPGRASLAVAKAAPSAAPTLTLSGSPPYPTFILGKPAVSALPSVIITDSDSTTLSGATVTVRASGLLGTFVSGDKLNFANGNGILGSYNTGTGVLTLSGNATLAQYEAALEAVTFSATQGGGLLGALSDRTIVVSVTDEISRTSDEALASVKVANPVTPSVSLSGTTTFVLGYSHVVALPSVTISDSDSPMLSGAKVTVRKDDLLFPDYVSGDTLNFTNQNGISIVSNTNGVLTLAGDATVAQYKAALESITFSATQVIDGLLGGTVSRKLTVTVTDELGLTSDAKTGTARVVRPTAPSVSVSGATPTYTVGKAGVVVLPTVTIADSESMTLTKATVTVRKDDFLFSDVVSGDKLNFSDQNGITGSYNTNTGVLTLTGTASLANYTTALQSVTFTATQVIDGLISGTVGRTITLTVTDETNLTSDSFSASVNVVRSVAPTVSLSGGPQTVVLGKTGAAVLPTVTITDSDSNVLTGAKVKVTAAPALIPVHIAGDTFNFASQNGISIVSNSAGVLTLTGNATVAHYKAALESITFSATSPGGLFGALLDRTFTVTVTDDSTATSNEVSRAVNIANPVLPTVSVSGPVPTFVIGKSIVTALPTVTMSDSDSSTLSKAIVTVKTDDGIFSTVVGGDVLGFNNTNPWGISGGYSNGVLTLTGNASLANYTSALQSVTFSATQNTTDRVLTVAVTATDDLNQASDTASATVKVAFPAPPTLSVSGATPTYLFGRSGVKLLPAVAIGDSDSATLSGARVTVVGTILGIPSSFVSGDALGFTNQNGISIASNMNGVLTLTGTATLAQYKTALESITFSATEGGGVFGAFVDRAVTITVTDEINRTSDEVSRSVKVDNPAPATVSVSGSTPTYLIGRAGVVALPSVTIKDSDSTEVAGAKVSVKTDEFFPSVVAGDVLGFNNSNAWGITGSYSGGVLALTGTASVTNYQLALMSITFSTTADTADRRLTITVTGADDQSVASSEASRTVKVGTTVTPTVSPSGMTPTFYLTKSSPLIALPGVTVGDPDSPLLSGASVTVKAGSTVVGSDVLAFNNSNAWGITGTFSNGVMSLTGSASAANYQAALQSITFAATTNTTTRTLTVTVTSPDDTTSTATATASIAVSNPVAPTVGLSGTDLIQLFGPSSTVILDGAARTVIGEATINDPDSTLMSKAVVMVRTGGGSHIASDVLAFTAANGITMQSNTSGVLTLVGSATKAAYKAALESVTLKVVDGGGLFGAPTGRTVSVTLTDELGSTGATSTVAVSVNLF